jgi:serine/threonine protein phosphatase 1
MRQFAIGDIHGCLDALLRLDEELHFSPTDTIITLGDYVDRGPDTKGVIDYLIQLKTRCNLICLRGNHEIMMLMARDDRSHLASWMSNGGDATLDSYAATSFKSIPPEHWEFMESTLPYHEADRDFFVHANAYPDYELVDQPEYMLYWEFLDRPVRHDSGKRMICGHTAQRSGKPLNFGHTVCIDTDVCRNGWLTCLDIRSNNYWQANQQKELRIEQL